METIFIKVLCSDRLPKVANKHYLTISQRGYETARLFDGKQFKTSYHDGEIIYWFEEVPINTIKADAWDEGVKAVETFLFNDIPSINPYK